MSPEYYVPIAKHITAPPAAGNSGTFVLPPVVSVLPTALYPPCYETVKMLIAIRLEAIRSCECST